MNDRQAAERFNRTLDQMAGADEWEKLPDAERFAAELALAHRLAAVDFSAESAARQRTRSRLLQELSAQADKETTMEIRSFRKGWALALVLLVIALAAATPAGQSAAQSVVELAQRWLVGTGTAVQTVEGDFAVVDGENGEKEILPADAVAMPEIDISESPFEEVRLSLAEVQGLVGFPVLAPAYLPDGYEFSNAWADDPDRAYVEYFRPMDGLLGLMQTRLGERYPQVQVTSSSDIPVEEVTVRGVDGLWLDSGVGMELLMWEENGINFQLSGSLDGLEEALRIAESLR